ncbi:C-terminal helicase domain-containing protein [Actinoplanes sp. NPDC026623]|uniref:C-terminal helicase domain-containing protein n=1 Tax=Actinoplanes sp. NPDC026623 TaxID=3155610 RepID=UPI0033FA8ED7
MRFRERVAQVYLRRNQEDVLRELPELVEENDWVELDTAEARVYADAVARRHFPDMRRAAYAPVGTVTAKIDRLLDIVAQSAAEGWKVVIFSQFLDVIEAVSAALAKSPQMLLTGKTPAGRRQEAIDRFTAHHGHFVLIGQIQAIGEGINLQAASVVVLTEPALKPSTEEQAIRRVYRMGQAARCRYTGCWPRVPSTSISRRSCTTSADYSRRTRTTATRKGPTAARPTPASSTTRSATSIKRASSTRRSSVYVMTKIVVPPVEPVDRTVQCSCHAPRSDARSKNGGKCE